MNPHAPAMYFYERPTHRKLRDMCNARTYLAPDRFDDLFDGVRYAHAIIEAEGCPGFARALLLLWIEDARKLLDAPPVMPATRPN